MKIRYLIAIGLLIAALTSCVAPVTSNHPSKPLAEKQKDYVECMATANQAAYGAGNWSSDPAIRSAIFANARDQYLAMCLESRGWYQGATPHASPPPPAPALMDAHVFRQCAQVALSKLGLYHGQVDGEESPMWRDVWRRYLDSHVELRHDERQSEGRRVIDRELTATHKRINWDACPS
jgi:hypothetical protein